MVRLHGCSLSWPLRLALVCAAALPAGSLAGQDGNLDTYFAPGSGSDGFIACSTVQADGKVLIGGSFNQVDGVDHDSLARLGANGGLDTNFDAGNYGPVGWTYSIVIQPNGQLLVGGYTTPGVARLNTNGTVDSSFNTGSGANNWVRSTILQPDGKVLIAGHFTSVDGVGRNHVARLNSDGSLDTGFDPGSGTDNGVLSMALQSDGKVLIGGAFATVNGVSRPRLARLNTDGSLDTSFDANTTLGGVETLVIQPNGKILMGGTFTTVGGTARNRIARVNSDGTIDTGFDPGSGADDEVFAIELQANNQVLIGGRFATVDGTARLRVARLNSDGSLDTSFDPGTASGATDSVYEIHEEASGNIRLAGNFTEMAGERRDRIARVTSAGSLTPAFELAEGANNTVRAIAVQPDGRILCGGSFTTMNGVNRSRIARLNDDGTLDTGFDPGGGADADVSDLALQPDGKVIIVGKFTDIDGTTLNRVARLNSDGSIDSSFNPGSGANYDINRVVLQPNGQIIIAGYFSSYNGVSRINIARLNSDGSLDTTFDAGSSTNQPILAVGLQQDGKVVIGGPFTQVAGANQNHISRLNANGSRDTGFAAGNGTNGTVSDIVLQPDQKILIGGSFTTFDGASCKDLARLNTAGNRDTGFNAPTSTNGSVTSISVQPDAKIVIGGSFTAPRCNLGRLLSDGTTDSTYTNNTYVAGSVYTHELQPDGEIVVGGSFTTLNNSTRNRIARLDNPSVLSAPTITSTPSAQVVVNSNYSYTITATGTPTPNIQVSNLPGWLSYSSATQTISGTAPATPGTTGTITVDATNSQGTDSQNFTIEICTLPQITSTAVTSVTVGQTYTYNVATTGSPAPGLLLSGNPSWLSLNGSILQGTPSASDAGVTGTITLTAYNSGGTDMQQFTVTVNLAPAITSSPPTTATAGQLYTHNLTADGYPTPAFGISGNPAWLTLAGSWLSGTPSASDIGTTGQITITASNGVNPDDTIQFTITVSGVAPTFTSTAVVFATVGIAYGYTATASGIPTPTFSAGSLPSWLSFNTSTAELSGTPALADIGLSAQIDITATNSEGSDIQSFQIQVNGLAPQITSSAPTSAVEGQLYTYTVAATGNPLPTLSAAGVPAWLTFNTLTGVLSGTPASADVGTSANITITGANGWTPDSTQNFTVTVSAAGGGGGGGGGSDGGCVHADRGVLLPLILLVLGTLAWTRSRRLEAP